MIYIAMSYSNFNTMVLFLGIVFNILIAESGFGECI